ncbi:MAG TPA: HGxxPAAW family protein [Thermomonospora sp.]|nr:HGxxPAAW family protein [Thermomonospora sp.]
MSGSHGGRPSSWAVVAVSITGFTVGGVALCIGPNWVLFGVGAAIVVLSGILGLAVGIFSDVVLDEPRVISETVGGTLSATGGEARRGGGAGEIADAPTKTDPEDRPHG